MHSQCGHGGDGFEAIGGWRFGNTINGCQAEYVLVPNAQANLAKIPDGLDRRGGAALSGHHVDRLLGRRARSREAGRLRRRLRAGTDRPVRDRGRAPGRGVAGDRRRQRAAAARVRAQDGRGRRAQLQGAGRRRRDQAAHRRRRRRRDRGARDAGDVRELPAQRAARRHRLQPRRLLGPPDGAARRVRRRPRRSHRSSRRSARAARSGCGGS